MFYTLIAMKKETLIIIFYILYFFWLFLITYLTAEAKILTYFSIGTVIFYFSFLKEGGDLLWFLLGLSIPLLLASISFKNWVPVFDFDILLLMPVWLPLAWGTTFVALRKLYLILSR